MSVGGRPLAPHGQGQLASLGVCHQTLCANLSHKLHHIGCEGDPFLLLIRLLPKHLAELQNRVSASI